MSLGGQELVIATANPHKVEELGAILGDGLAALGIRLVGLKGLEARGLGPFHEPDETGGTFEQNAAIKAMSYARQTGMACLADDSGLEIDALAGRPGVISSHYFNDGRTDGAAAGVVRGERDQRNNRRVLDELRGVPFERRSARFVCVMALAVPNPSRGAGFQPARPSAQRRPPTSGNDGATPNDGSVWGAGGLEARRPLGDPDGFAGVRHFRGVFEGRIGLPQGECPLDRPDLLIPRGVNGFGYDPIFLVAPDYRRTGAELEPAEKNRTSHRARAAAMLGAWLQSGDAECW